MKELVYPFTAEQVRGLEAGEAVHVTGRVWTGRDQVHRHLHGGGACPVPLRDGAIYHCGPVVMQARDGSWRVTAAGPTTSAREEPYMAGIIAAHGLRVVIGKGGMGPRTAEACARFGCVYLEAVGGAAQVLAGCIRRVDGVHFAEEFGTTEAMWELEVERLPAVVTIDCLGRNLHDAVEREAARALRDLFENEPGA